MRCVSTRALGEALTLGAVGFKQRALLIPGADLLFPNEGHDFLTVQISQLCSIVFIPWTIPTNIPTVQL